MTEWDYAIRAIRDHGRFIAGGIIMGCIIAILILIFQTPLYKVEMIIAPTERTGVPSLSSFLPKGAADAPALQYFVERIDASQSSDFTIFETLFNSPDIIEKLKGNDDYHLPHNLYSYMKKNLKIRSYGMTPFRTITLLHDNPTEAKAILYDLYRYTDNEVRLSKKIKTSRRIAYLNTQLESLRNPDHRNAVIALLKEQEQTSMMASIDNEFAAHIVSVPYSSKTPHSPNWKIILPLFIFVGGFIGLMLGGLRQAISKK